MCWNAEVSLNTFIYALISFVIVIGFNRFPLFTPMIALSVSLMQLYEYFIWKNIHNKKIIDNISIIGPIIILLQLLLLNYAFLKGKERIIAIVLIFILFIISLIIRSYDYNNLKITVGENGHLLWHWADLPPILLIFIFILYLYPLSKKNNKTAFIFITIALLISLYYYYKYKTWGTMWCYFSNLIWIYLIIASIYLYINNEYDTD
jgi:hypothetical protein